MVHDVELMRELMFVLETRQISPRTTIVISIEEEARDIGCMPEAVEHSLNVLQDLDYIEGPGADEPGFWLFRKLTLKGNHFIKATRHERDWTRLKQHYERFAQGA